MHSFRKNERQVCSTDLPESPLDAVNGPTRRSSRTHESVRLIAGQDLGAAHVLSSISPAAETPAFRHWEEPRELHQQQTFRRMNIRTRRHDGSRSSGGDGRTPCRSGSFGRRSPVGAPGRGVGRPILRCANRRNLPRLAHQLASAYNNWKPCSGRILRLVQRYWA